MPGSERAHASASSAEPAAKDSRRPEVAPEEAPFEMEAVAHAAIGEGRAISRMQQARAMQRLQRTIGNGRTTALVRNGAASGLAPRAAPAGPVASRSQPGALIQRGFFSQLLNGIRNLVGMPKKVDAKEADKLVRAYFEKDLPEATKKDAKADGHVNIVGEADFKKAYERVMGEIDDDYPLTNAFVDRSTDPPTVWGHEDRVNPTTVLHEGMHFYSNLTWKTTVGFNGNEGLTEYFTRDVVAEEGLTERSNYQTEFDEIKALAGVVGDDKLRLAYFNGDVDAVKNALNKAAGDGAFDTWMAAMKNGKYGDARTALTKK